jgi:hypothetical protein
MARWLIATLGFLAIGWLSYRYGHTAALVTLLVVLVGVAVFGGHGRRSSRRPEAPPDEPPAAP